jgi:pilus assembly protein FimV
MLFSKIRVFPIGEAHVPPRDSKPGIPVSGGESREMHLRFVRKGAMALAVAAIFACSAAYAAGLGRLNVRSALGQPLDAEVEVPVVDREELASIQVRLGTQAAFKQSNLEFNPALTQLRFEIQSRPDGSSFVRISSAQPISEPYLDLLLELTWASGRVVREYTVLLDPPSLRQAPAEVIPPVAAAPAPAPAPAEAVAPAASQVAPVPAPVPVPVEAALAPAPAPMAAAPAPLPAPAPVAQVPAPAPTPPPAPRAPEAVAARPAPAAKAAPASVRVRSGDTASQIAVDHREEGVSLDQMLIAMLQANPSAFVEGNVNRLRAGQDLAIPDRETALAIDHGQASREVQAQSADFNAYRSRLAASVASAPPTPATGGAAATGQVTARVQDRGESAKPGDKLKITQGGASAKGGSAAAGKDEEVARQRAEKEAKDRIEQLRKTNEEIQRANELRQKEASAAQRRVEEQAAKDKAARDAAEAKKRADEQAAKEKAARDAADAKKRADEQAAKDAEAKKLADAKKAAEDAARAKAAAEKAAAKPAEKPVEKAPEKSAEKAAPAPRPAAPTPPASAAPGIVDQLTSPVGLGALIGLLVVALAGLNFWRRRRGGKGDFHTGGDLAANSLFGATGGQSVDTASASTFNSSFIPAASQLDSNEVDPVAEADVYIAYGREEQAEDILKEALRLQPERHPVRVKLLEIYSRRGDKASFNALAEELHQRTGGLGEDWDRAAKLGRALDPGNAMFGGTGGESRPGAPAAAGFGASGPAGMDDLSGPTQAADVPMQFEPLSAGALGGAGAPRSAGPASVISPSTIGGPETQMPLDPFTSDRAGDSASRTQDEAAEIAGPATVPGRANIDFGSLDFDLGPTKIDLDLPTGMREEIEAAAGTPAAASAGRAPARSAPEPEPPTIPSLDLMFEPTQPPGPATRPSPPTVSGTVPIPKIDLNIPPATRVPEARPGSLEESLSRPTLVGAVGSLSSETVPRLTSNTDQATVPLIDFDLSGADTTMGGRRTETAAGSPMAAQMATKLDLARGYIDLGVKDGARELLEEVMKDGTREQRSQAVELIKLIEA